MEINLHPGQSKLFKELFIDHSIRFQTIVASRGWGKSYYGAVVSLYAAFELMKLDASVPNKNIYIVAPTYSQTKDIFYPILVYELGCDSFTTRTPSQQIGRFSFPNNVNLILTSHEAIERMRGKGAYFILGDEISSWTKKISAKDAYEDILLPCVVTRWSKERAKLFKAPSPGRIATISTPKGYNYLYDLYGYPEINSDYSSHHFDYKTSPFISPEEIERIRATTDAVKFAREYDALFEGSGNNIFYCFDRKLHIKHDLEYFKEDEMVYAAIDFNVMKMCTSFCAIRGGQIFILDEISGSPDTESLTISMRAKFPKHNITCLPDPTGKSRKTSATIGRTDFSILRNAGFIVLSRSKSPPIVDSVNAVNRMLQSADKQIRFYISSKCKEAIKSLERTVWVDGNSDTATIDKTMDIEHFSDGIRYLTEYFFPIQKILQPVKRGFMF
jgi:hypothetical protein